MSEFRFGVTRVLQRLNRDCVALIEHAGISACVTCSHNYELPPTASSQVGSIQILLTKSD